MEKGLGRPGSSWLTRPLQWWHVWVILSLLLSPMVGGYLAAVAWGWIVGLTLALLSLPFVLIAVVRIVRG